MRNLQNFESIQVKRRFYAHLWITKFAIVLIEIVVFRLNWFQDVIISA